MYTYIMRLIHGEKKTYLRGSHIFSEIEIEAILNFITIIDIKASKTIF